MKKVDDKGHERTCFKRILLRKIMVKKLAV